MRTRNPYMTGIWHAALPAALLTFVIFTALPLLDILRRGPQHQAKVYDISRVELPPPPPPPPRAKPQTIFQEHAPKPRLPRTRQRIPLSAALHMNVAMHDFAGDFDVNFQVETPDLLGAGVYVFEIAEIDQVPMPIARFNPPYPSRARMRRIEGKVQLEFVVGRDGGVRDATVAAAAPQGFFEDAALRAVKQWRFRPGTKNGEAVPVRVRQTIKFTLER